MKKRGYFKILIVVICMFMMAYFSCKVTPYYVEKTHYDKNEVRFIIDDTEKTKGLPDEIIIKDGKVMLSMDTIKKYFDEYAYYDEKYDTYIVAYDKYVAKFPVNQNKVSVNGVSREVNVPVQRIEIEKLYDRKLKDEELESINNISGDLKKSFDILKDVASFNVNKKDENVLSAEPDSFSLEPTFLGTLEIVPQKLHKNASGELFLQVKERAIKIYVPIEEFESIYDIDVEYNEKVIVTTRNIDFVKANISNKLHVKKYKKVFCLTTGTTEKEEAVYIWSKDFDTLNDDEYVFVRTATGDLGYVKKSNMKINENLESQLAKVDEETKKNKLSLTWEAVYNVKIDRSKEAKKDGLDVVAPTWINVSSTSGDLTNKIDLSYLKDAREKGYEVWPTIKNDDFGLDKTSELVTDMKNRERFINNILAICKNSKYEFKGINLDFENMYKKDRDEYSELVRELSCTLRQNNIIATVDVNVPDGSDNWSLCYDSKAISDAADYIMVMTYDQYSNSSTKPGPVASLDWVETNVKKLVERDGIESEKLFLGVPFYSRIWKVRNDEIVYKGVLSMPNAKKYKDNNPNSVTWSESAGQNIITYNEGKNTVMIWLEDEEAISKKMELVNKYNLAGVASWSRGFASDDVWNTIYDAIKE